MAWYADNVSGLAVGQYGVAIEITLKDTVTKTAADVSTYTGTKEIKARSPNDVVFTFTGTFTSDGSDGKIYFTPSSGNTFDVDGEWEAQAQLQKTSTMAISAIFKLYVDEQIT